MAWTPISEPGSALRRLPGWHDGKDARVRAFVDRLSGVLSEWRRCASESTLERRLARLLGELKPLLPSRSGWRLDADRLAALLPALSTALSDRRVEGGSINPWTIAGMKRREVRNAAALAALWTPAQVGEVGPAFLGEFFARCGTRARQSLPGPDELGLGYRMRIENCPGPDGSDRVDLVIETARHLVGIEIKIDAREGREQLTRYVEAIGRSARQLDKAARVIFLAPFAPSRDDVIAADWSTIRAAAAAALPSRRSEYGKSHHLVAQFARHVRGF
jgi:hypothetical protein